MPVQVGSRGRRPSFERKPLNEQAQRQTILSATKFRAKGSLEGQHISREED